MGERAADQKSEKPEEFTPAGATGDDPLTRNLKRAFGPVEEELPQEWLHMLDQLDDKSEKSDD